MRRGNCYRTMSFFRCLEKNPDNRPFMIELMEHPFFTQLIGPNGSDHHVNELFYLCIY